MKKIGIFTLTLFMMQSVVYAANLNCSGSITHAYINDGGGLVVRSTWRSDYTQLCDIDTDPVQCSLWASLITSSITSDKEVIIRYRDIEACNTLPIYGNAPKPEYVMIVR